MSEYQSSSSRRQTGRTADVPDRSAAAEPALGGAPCAGAIESAGGDICGHLAVSTVSAWSVCLDRWATDMAGVGGLGC